jgi:hypothetical protein
LISPYLFSTKVASQYYLIQKPISETNHNLAIDEEVLSITPPASASVYSFQPLRTESGKFLRHNSFDCFCLKISYTYIKLQQLQPNPLKMGCTATCYGLRSISSCLTYGTDNAVNTQVSLFLLIVTFKIFSFTGNSKYSRVL